MTFNGSMAAEAALTLAAAASNTQVVLTFSNALKGGATDSSRYSLGSGAPAVKTAALSVDKKKVTLTTDPQSTKSYTVTVSPVVAGVEIGVEPVTASAKFTGIGIPAVATASAPSSRFIRLTFTEPVGENGDAISGYVLNSPACVSTAIVAVTVSDDRKSAVLQTTVQSKGTYTVGLAGTALKSFAGSTNSEAYLTSAKATSNTQIVLKFSEAMASDANNAKYYDFGEDGPEISQIALSSDKKTVTFTTKAQWVTAYTVTVIDLKSSDNATMDPSKPASISFMGVGRTVASNGVASRVVGAVSTGYNKVLVSFSEMMDASAVVSQHYSVARKRRRPRLGHAAGLCGEVHRREPADRRTDRRQPKPSHLYRERGERP